MGYEFNREFGFCKILWKIDDFCLATCRKNWSISSSKFSVRAAYFTNWKITLKPKPKDNGVGDSIISASLNRLDDDPGPDVVRASWKISLRNGVKSKYCSAETEHYFRKNTCCEENLKDVGDILNEFQPFEKDTLYLQCQLIVSFDNHTKLDMRNEQGIKMLSADMSMLYSSAKTHDVTLKINNKSIPAHKPILYVRNPTLASIFNSLKPEIKSIDLIPSKSGTDHGYFVNSEAVEKVFGYLYSGNLEYVLDKPSVSIYECAVMFGVREIIQYYCPDELTMQFSVDAEEMIIFWIITDFESVSGDCILSPPLTEAASDTTWRLRLITNGEENHEGYISIYAEVIEGLKLQDICLEFALINANHDFSNYKRMQKSITFGGILGFADFVKRKWLKNSCFLEKGVLRIACKLRILVFDGIISSSCNTTEFCSTSVVTTITKEELQSHSFESLSKDLSCLFKEGIFSDAKIYCENKIFNVHKCMLSARSDNFAKILWEKLKDTDKADVSDMKPETLNILLLYLYSGTIANMCQDSVWEIYTTAEKFNMYGLMNKCLQFHNSY